MDATHKLLVEKIKWLKSELQTSSSRDDAMQQPKHEAEAAAAAKRRAQNFDELLDMVQSKNCDFQKISKQQKDLLLELIGLLCDNIAALGTATTAAAAASEKNGSPAIAREQLVASRRAFINILTRAIKYCILDKASYLTLKPVFNRMVPVAIAALKSTILNDDSSINEANSFVHCLSYIIHAMALFETSTLLVSDVFAGFFCADVLKNCVELARVILPCQEVMKSQVVHFSQSLFAILTFALTYHLCDNVGKQNCANVYKTVGIWNLLFQYQNLEYAKDLISLLSHNMVEFESDAFVRSFAEEHFSALFISTLSMINRVIEHRQDLDAELMRTCKNSGIILLNSVRAMLARGLLTKQQVRQVQRFCEGRVLFKFLDSTIEISHNLERSMLQSHNKHLHTLLALDYGVRQNDETKVLEKRLDELLLANGIKPNQKMTEKAGKRLHRCCAHCNKVAASLPLNLKLKACSRCRTEYYCSVECQKADWPLQKKTCTIEEARTPSK